MNVNDVNSTSGGGDAPELESWAALVAVDAVDPGDEEFVRELRRDNPLFDDLVDRYRRDAADLAASAAVAPPAGLRGSVLDAVAGRSPSAEDATVVPISSGRRGAAGGGAGVGTRGMNRWRLRSRELAAAAAVVVAIGGGVWWSTYGSGGADGTGDGDGGSVVAGPSETPTTVVERVDVAGGVVEVELVEGHSEATVHLTGVPAPDEGSAYQMWLVGAESSRSVGVMGPEDVTDDMTVEIDGVDAADRLMISVEPAGGSAAPTQALVDIPLRS